MKSTWSKVKERQRQFLEPTKEAIEAMGRFGIIACEAGEILRKFVDAYEDLRLYVRRLYFVRLP